MENTTLKKPGQEAGTLRWTEKDTQAINDYLLKLKRGEIKVTALPRKEDVGPGGLKEWFRKTDQKIKREEEELSTKVQAGLNSINKKIVLKVKPHAWKRAVDNLSAEPKWTLHDTIKCMEAERSGVARDKKTGNVLTFQEIEKYAQEFDKVRSNVSVDEFMKDKFEIVPSDQIINDQTGKPYTKEEIAHVQEFNSNPNIISLFESQRVKQILSEAFDWDTPLETTKRLLEELRVLEEPYFEKIKSQFEKGELKHQLPRPSDDYASMLFGKANYVFSEEAI